MKLKRKFVSLTSDDIADTEALKAPTTTAQTIAGEQVFSTAPRVLNSPSPTSRTLRTSGDLEAALAAVVADGQAIDWEFLPDGKVRLIRYEVTIPSDAVPVAIIDDEVRHPLPYEPPTPRNNCWLQYRTVERVVPVYALDCDYSGDYPVCTPYFAGYRTVKVIEAYEVCP